MLRGGRRGCSLGSLEGSSCSAGDSGATQTLDKRDNLGKVESPHDTICLDCLNPKDRIYPYCAAMPCYSYDTMM